MMSPKSLDLSRAIIGIVGIGALLISVGGLTSGSSLTDPVFPGGLALGVLAFGAAAWATEPGFARAIVTWLGLLAVLVALGVFSSFAFRTPSPDVIALFAVPGLIVLTALGRLAFARMGAGGRG